MDSTCRNCIGSVAYEKNLSALWPLRLRLFSVCNKSDQMNDAPKSFGKKYTIFIACINVIYCMKSTGCELGNLRDRKCSTEKCIQTWDSRSKIAYWLLEFRRLRLCKMVKKDQATSCWLRRHSAHIRIVCVRLRKDSEKNLAPILFFFTLISENFVSFHVAARILLPFHSLFQCILSHF